MTVPLRQYAHSRTKDALPGSEQLSEPQRQNWCLNLKLNLKHLKTSWNSLKPIQACFDWGGAILAYHTKKPSCKIMPLSGGRASQLQAPVKAQFFVSGLPSAIICNICNQYVSRLEANLSWVMHASNMTHHLSLQLCAISASPFPVRASSPKQYAFPGTVNRPTNFQIFQ